MTRLWSDPKKPYMRHMRHMTIKAMPGTPQAVSEQVWQCPECDLTVTAMHRDRNASCYCDGSRIRIERDDGRVFCHSSGRSMEDRMRELMRRAQAKADARANRRKKGLE